MPIAPTEPPVVLVLAGHDPTGGAGIQADIEAIASFGCHAACVITALTAQNTTRLAHVVPQDPDQFNEQLALVVADMPLAACKIGVCPSPLLMQSINEFLSSRPDLPVIVDPVLVAGSGGTFLEQDATEALCKYLLPCANLVTPNGREARQIGNHMELPAAANNLLGRGARAVLVTGGDESGERIVNTLYRPGETPWHYRFRRLPGTFHGSGCTLSAAIAAAIARGDSLLDAVARGQDYTWHCLEAAARLGKQQLHPRRLYWRGGKAP